MGYEYEQRADGILVRNARFVKPLKLNDRQELAAAGIEVNAEFMAECAANYRKRTGAGKIYNATLNHRGNRVGRILRQDVTVHRGQPAVEMDVLLTEPAVRERWLRGELPEISADIDLATRDIYAVSILEKDHGHFGFDQLGSDFIPQDLQVALASEGHKAQHIIRLKLAPPEPQEIVMDEKRLLELMAENNKKLLADVNTSIDAKVAPLLKKAANTDPLDPMNDVAELRREYQQKLELQTSTHNAALEKARDVERKVAEAMAADIGLSERAYRAELEKRDVVARGDYHRLALERVKNGRPVFTGGDENGTRRQDRVELELKAEYAVEAEAWKAIGISEEQYVHDQRGKRNLAALGAGR